ncbi:hypothetical protein [Xiamenia xianingshaonis]|uniref:Uncharacterized protein n=1 Tax=Xiamenia xianingshaonis TaxID=2682776 RepID=A0A9E6MP79_9ACTN|nr:hypothetical protein [Xiamenia xianingshaonis]NHM14933.1 hypothetical protein [Xiamenia xianingshaonis]QTU83741.1 hypothetical protein J7S26_04920 [Xiamenia xianingshaonis]
MKIVGMGIPELLIMFIAVVLPLAICAAFLVAVYFIVRKAVRDELRGCGIDPRNANRP